MNGTRKAFTLVELMLVVGIMGLLGSISVGGYRAMRRGMEERGALQNVNQFIRNAYQRAMIDRQPTAIYFWNETLRQESDDESIIVVGRAVAVRRAGRFSAKDGQYLVDEFGDLGSFKGTDDEGEEDGGDEAEDGMKTYLYRINGDETGFKRSVVGQATARVAQNIGQMMTDVDWREQVEENEVAAYGYYLRDAGGIDWKAGDAYGLEFAEISLPNNYIFESTYNKSVSDPVAKLSTVMKFSPERGAGGQTIAVSALRPGKGGNLTVEKVDTTLPADSELSQQNQ